MFDKMEWQVQKACIDVADYELIIEKQKTHWNCEQTRESWKWLVSYHGSIVASGSDNDPERAKQLAMNNLPEDIKTEYEDKDCDCD